MTIRQKSRLTAWAAVTLGLVLVTGLLATAQGLPF
jgi:hypothetical protein